VKDAIPVPDDPRLERWRADTPGVAHRIHLNNAGAALMPRPVIEAMTSHLDLEAEIGGYEAAHQREAEIADVYEQLAALLDTHARNVALVPSATSGFVRALSTFDFAPGDVLVTSRSDYVSNQLQYLALARRRGVRFERAADRPEGGIDPESVRAILRRRRCRLVAISWIPTNSGLVQDVRAVGEVCRAAGVPYLVDGCQALGQLPIDVAAIGCDYLSATTRKFLRGPRGMGVLFVSDAALARGDHPLFVDMRGANWIAADAYEIVDSARRYEEWELPYALVLGVGAAARYAREVGMDTAQRRATALAARARRALAELPGVRVLDRGRELCAIVTFAVEGLDPAAIASTLARDRINVNVSLRMYAVIDFDDKGVPSAVRVSPHYYNTVAEVDALVHAIAGMTASVRGPSSPAAAKAD
jgi:selenocysteine lyase/cysteine desulfurase